MTKRDFQQIAEAIYTTRGNAEDVRPLFEVANRLAEIFAVRNSRFDRERFIEACETGKCRGMRQVGGEPKAKPYQPKTGAACGCRRGVERDNCPTCEGTGQIIDFAAIRARKVGK